MAELIGKDFKLFRNTGTFAVPVWNEITKARDVSTRLEAETAEIKNRSLAWVLQKSTFKRMEFTFELSYDTAPDDWAALRDAFINGTSVDLWAADGGAATGSQGPRAECLITQFEKAEPLEDGAAVSIVAVPTPTANAQPLWFTHA